MRKLDNLRDVGHLKLKSISTDVVNQVDSDLACKRQYDATRSENYVATKIYYDLNQYFDVEVFKERFAKTDILVQSETLNIKFYVEVKCRYKQQIEYDTLLISKSKIDGIIGLELYPTFIFFINTLEEEVLIVEVDNDDFLKNHCKSSGNYYFLDKKISMNYNEFIENRLTYIESALRQRMLNLSEIFI